ncbi:hypothetical protein P3T76_009830 [Phytophthora citrophthora]|uniref:Uncharacterized protein n=1 Tax=Phytophthora citrophthora TaxID=4793 RepID=A0AAD9GET8_9STRA|nr:hypothetical protein P3T76_009830 [Phytophthora citrophthora]
MNYAKLTNWVVKTGLSKTITVEDSVLRKLVKEQHFFSGGSLRQFCQARKEATLQAVGDCPVNRDEAVNLAYNFRGGTYGCREDRLRRHYITDCHKEQDYQDSRCWKLFVDSGYVLSKLGPMVDMDNLFNLYQYAKSVGAGFHSITYKQLFHNAVRGSIAKQQPVVVWSREGSQYEKLEIQAKVDCCGEDEASCYRCLSTLKDDTYWYPDYQFFPFIDAVATCEAFPIGSKRSEAIIAFIQMTTRSEQKMKGERLSRLNEEMNKNQLLTDKPRAFVVVVPDADVCENFQLQDEPGLSTFPTLVGYFTRTTEVEHSLLEG